MKEKEVIKTKVKKPVSPKKATKTTEKKTKKETKSSSKKFGLIRNKTLIIGCGRLGASVANKIGKEGRNILIVDENKNAFELLDDNYTGEKVVGDVIDVHTLENAHIMTANEIIITTGDDNLNIYIALLARKIYDVPHVYVRLDDPEITPILEGEDIEVILPFQLTYDKLDLMRGGK